MGGWVGEWLSCCCIHKKVEEDKAVRMSYCGLGVVWVGGWVGGRRRKRVFFFSPIIHV